MKINPFFQENEEYYCLHCNKNSPNYEFNRNGKCPICGNLISIKLKINDNYHSCHRISPNELEVGDLMVLRDDSYEVLNIQRNANHYKIALKGFTVIEVDSDSTLTKIFGGWYY